MLERSTPGFLFILGKGIVYLICYGRNLLSLLVIFFGIIINKRSKHNKYIFTSNTLSSQLQNIIPLNIRAPNLTQSLVSHLQFSVGPFQFEDPVGVRPRLNFKEIVAVLVVLVAHRAHLLHLEPAKSALDVEVVCASELHDFVSDFKAAEADGAFFFLQEVDVVAAEFIDSGGEREPAYSGARSVSGSTFCE